MPLSALIQEFFTDGKYRKLSENTTKMYSQILKAFQLYCKAQGIEDFQAVLSNNSKNYAPSLQDEST